MLKLESLPKVLAKQVKDPGAILDVLLTALAKGQHDAALWESLHSAAARDEILPELAFAYEKALSGRRIKLISPANQAQAFLHAAEFLGDMFNDADGAIGYAERALAAAPSHEGGVELLERLLRAKEYYAKLAKLYVEMASAEKEPEKGLALLRQAAAVVDGVEGSDEIAIEVYQRILRIDPTDVGALDALQTRFLSSGRHREAVRLLEQAAAKAEGAEASKLRSRLIEVYTDELGEPQRAMPHVEALLREDPGHERALGVAEALLENKVMAPKAAAALAAAYLELGMTDHAAAMLTRELKVARGPRKTAVQKQLAILRQDALGDPAGALELMGPAVAADPGDDDLRRRFVQLSVALNQPLEAAKRLVRAVQTAKEDDVRARVGVEIGEVYLQSGDVKRAQTEFEKVVDAGGDEGAVLGAARRLAELYGEAGEQKKLAGALDLAVRLDRDERSRQESARRLARVCDELGEPERAIAAYEVLLGSPWEDEALSRLEALYEAARSEEGLVVVLERRAARSKDPVEARELAFRAADLRSSKDGKRALEAWQSFLATFGPSRDAYARLIPLLEREKRWSEVVDALRQQIEVVTGEERAVLLGRLGQVRLGRLGDQDGALEAFRAALEVDPREPASRSALEKLVSAAPSVLAAARVLEPVYRAERRYEDLVRVLEVRGEQAQEAVTQLEAFEEAVGLCEGELNDAQRALQLAGRGLCVAVASAQGSVSKWLARVNALAQAAGSSTLRAQVLSDALGDRAVESPETLELARAAGEALAATDDVERAVEVYRRAMAFDPSSAELVQRVDELLALSGSPEDRLALYAGALEQPCEPGRRKELLHAMARVQRRELKDNPAAIATWRRTIDEDPRDQTAHQGLVEVFGEQQDWDSLAEELGRVLALSSGERRNGLLEQLAEVHLRKAEAPQAMECFRLLVQEGVLDDGKLARIEGLAAEHDDHVLLREVLARRIALSDDEDAQADLLERLGLVEAQNLARPQAAADAWMRAARLSETAAVNEERARRLYERVLEVSEDGCDAADRLTEIYAATGSWDRVPATFARWARSTPDDKRVLAKLSALEARAQEAGASEVLVRLLDEALGRESLAPERSRQLLRTKARVLRVNQAKSDEVALIFREIVEANGDDAPAAVDEFGEFLANAGVTPERVEDRRWLYEQRASRASDPTAVLVAWARTEEAELQNPSAAAALYERVLRHQPGRTDALTELARLQATTGDPASALATLQELRAQCQADDLALVDGRIAGLLLEHLNQPEKALEVAEGILDTSPTDAEALQIVHRLLGLPKLRASAATVLERAAEGADDAQARATVLETLLAMEAEGSDLIESRRRWYERLLDCRADDEEASLEIAIRGALEHPAAETLWAEAERFARRLDRPGPVADAYAAALEQDLPSELAEEVGRRMVEFHEEWFEDPERVVVLLERVLKLSPGAGWAFDRLKLAFNASARWEDLFRLYDGALRNASTDEERVGLLREATMAAKDFAADPGRAVGYLEQLHWLQPEDVGVEATLERLYERLERNEALIELLTRRLRRVSGDDLHALRRRLAELWLNVGEAIPAFELLCKMRKDPRAGAETYDLFERLVRVDAALASIAPGVDPGEDRPASVRELSARYLRDYYEKDGRLEDVARMLEVALEFARNTAERVERLDAIVQLRLKRLDDQVGAFQNVCSLVTLQPALRKYRKLLHRLASGIGAHDRQVAVLAAVAREQSKLALRVELLREAADVHVKQLDDPAGAIELHLEVLELAENDRELALVAARDLDPLLEAAGRSDEHCMVLERRAELEQNAKARRSALGMAARVSSDILGDLDRAVRNWRARLDADPGDEEALDGLCDCLDRAERYEELIGALQARANVGRDAEKVRADLVRVARLFEAPLGDLPAAIQAWQAVRERVGADLESFDALVPLFEAEERWEDLAVLIAAEAERERDPERRTSLFGRLGTVHRTRTARPDLSVDAFVAAGDWDEAIATAGGAELAREVALEVGRQLLDHAVAHWTKAADSVEGAARAAAWAIEDLGNRLRSMGRHGDVADLLLRGSELPFDKARQRELKREAACVCSDQLQEDERAIEIFREIFAQDPGDDVANASVSRLAGLLEERGLFSEIAVLWEKQALSRERGGDRATAAALWARAADLWEREVKDIERAIAGYRAGAGLGGEVALESLARIHDARGEHKRVAEALEWLCAQSSREALAERALRLAEAYVACGERGYARSRLEDAAVRAIDASAVRRRLAELYREDEAWAPLADLLTKEAARAPDARGRLALLREAAGLHVEQRGEPNDAVPLLEQAVELDQDDPALRLELSRALELAERYEDAAGILRAQIERYGSRRPKNRAVVHFQLARVSMKAGRRAEAMSELGIANKIDPAHPGILQALARLAFEEGQHERAERTYRALLLVIKPSDGPEAPSRAEALLDLSEIAAHREDSIRASEFVESAFEAALETEFEAAGLESALRARGREDLLARSIEGRLERARRPEDAARALADLVMLRSAPASDGGAEQAHWRKQAEAIEAGLERSGVTDERAWSALSRVYDWLGDSSAEVKILERRVASWAQSDQQPPDADPFYQLARIRLADGETRDEGVALLERALAIRPDMQRAAELVRVALEDDPTHRRCIALLEGVARQGGLKRDLALAMALALRLPGANPAGMGEAVALAKQVGDLELVGSILEAGLSLDLRDADAVWVRRELASVVAAEGDLSRALDLREEAAELQMGEERRDLLLDVARAATEELGDTTRAARLYTTLLQKEPADRGAWEPLLAIYREQKQADQLVDLLERTAPLVESLADRSALRVEQASVLLDRGRGDEAATMLQEVLEEDPTQAKAALLLSAVLERAGRHEDLISLLQTQLDMAKDRQDPDAIVSLSMRIGDLLEQQQRSDDARDIYQAVLDWVPNCRSALEAGLRVAEQGNDPYALADALEALLGALEGEEAAETAARLMTLRAEQKDAEGLERALAAGFAGAPSNEDLREGLIKIYQKRQAWADVAETLKRAVEVAPDGAALVPRLIEAYRSAGQVEEALAVLEGVLEDENPSASMLEQRAGLLTEMGRHEDALRDLERAYEVGGDCLPEFVAALERAAANAEPETGRSMKLRLAAILREMGDREGAKVKLGELVKADAQDRVALRQLADLEMEAQAWDGATKAYRQLIALEEGDALVDVALRLCNACEQAGRLGDAQGGLERALNVSPGNDELRARLAQVYEANGDHRQLAAMLEADAAHATAVADRLELLLRAGALYLEPEGDVTEAIRVLERARELSAENLTGVVLLARAFSAIGRGEEALQLLNTTAEAHRGKRIREMADVYAEISRFHLEDGMLTDAMEALQKAYEMDPRNGTLAMQLGQLALEIEEFDSAQRAFRSATMMKPYNPETGEGITSEAKADAHYCLAWLAYNEGDVRKAKLLASKTLAEYSQHEHALALMAELEGK